jgi:hydrogenase-4 component F
MLTILLLAVPLATGLVAATQSWRRWVGWLCTASLGCVLILGVVLATQVVHGRAVSAFSGILRADALSAFMVIVIGAIGLLATTQSVRYLDAEIVSGRGTARHATLYAVLVQGFITAMLLAVLSGNVGVMWVAVEATTIITTFLVGHRKTRGCPRSLVEVRHHLLGGHRAGLSRHGAGLLGRVARRARRARIASVDLADEHLAPS